MPAPQCGLVVLPPASVSDALRQAQAQAGRAYVSEYPLHLTVKNLFQPNVDMPAIELAVARVCAAAQPFTISLGRPAIFPNPNGNFVVLRVARTRQLMCLHRQLVRALAPLTSLTDPAKDVQEASGFLPHVTLLRDVPDAQVADVLAALAKRHARHAFSVQQIVLVCQGPGIPWHETQHFPLGTGAAPARAKA